MENSFFEYRNDKEADSDSAPEFIDNSFADASFGLKKKNGTVFVAESDESTEDDSEVDSKLPQDSSKSVVGRSIADKYVVLSSDDDASKRGSIRRQSNSSTKLVLSSSDEEQGSPEIVPKKRPPVKQKSISKEQDESIIGRKTRKRMILLDSDADNSIVIEQDKHKKLLCMKETPLKIDSGKNRLGNDSEVDDEESTTGDDEQDLESDEDRTTNVTPKNNRAESKSNRSSIKYNHSNITESGNEPNDDNDESGNESDVYEPDEESDGDEIDEDKMVMSRATRMSIMGMIPKDNDSDDSDFIQSDDSHRESGSSSTNSLKDLPDVTIGTIPQNIPTKDTKCSPKKPTNGPQTDEGVHEEQNLDTSKITCSPFSSPLKDISNRTIDYDPNETKNKDDKDTIVIDDPKENPSSVLKNKVLSNLVANKENYIRYDDDVTIIDREPEIIALSSDDEDESELNFIEMPRRSKSPTEAQREKSPRVKKSPKAKLEKAEKVSNDIKQYLVPPSYPNQVVYVKKHVRENELTKLEALKEDLKNIRYLLEQMDVNTLPDRGAKVIDRLTRLEAEVRRQGDKVASMLVEPDNPTAEDIARDGFDKDKGLSWDDIQKASNAVQPRMFGKQAMATHMAERHLILDRLRDLYESLASRPAESELATQPRGVNTKLMPHQLHALAWLKWRETQRPRAGILADDMGLGKTITMISLAVSDKETRIDDDDDDDEDDPPVKGKMSRGGTLVVCPASLVQQWAGEVTHHCGSSTLSVCLHHGPARAQMPHRLATYDLVVTTYNILQRDNEKNGVLMRVAWRRAILDEAHIVRNHKSATSAAVSALKASRRWCLTGTPVQNKDLDLFALLKFLKCSPFDDLTMWKKWVDNKSLGGQERLNTVMRCILLRRTKVQLQQKGQLNCLPDRTAHEQQVTLTKAEMNVYQKVLVFSKTLFGQFLHQRAEKNSDGGPMAPGKDSEYAKMHKRMIALQGAKPVKSHEILVLLLRLRQVCCHCGLIAAMLDGDMEEAVDEDPAGKDLLAELNKLSLEDSRRKSKNEKEDDEPEMESTTAAEAIRSVLSPNNPVFNLENHSSKIKAVMDCLEENVFAKEGEKAVVVSQWTSVLRLVERGLGARHVRSVTLSGAVAVAARPPLVAALNDARSPVRVMLLSLCAGGVGLNLCGANHLLLLDPHWNPQLEQQAQDRVYRVGQTKHVHVYRFMCVDTVEQTIRKLQEAKLELADNVLTGARNNNASKLTIEDLKMLFNMGE